MKEKIKNYQAKVDKKLIIRQRIFLILVLILIIIDILNIIDHKLNIFLAIIGFIFSITIGLFLSRMFKIFWHEEKEKVVSKLDTVGFLFLILYIIIELSKEWIFGHWLSGETLTSFSLIILTGLILGRFLGTVNEIDRILNETKNN